MHCAEWREPFRCISNRVVRLNRSMGRSFVTSIGTRQSTIWVHDARGDRQITSEGLSMLPSISPDGRKLYYLVRAGGTASYISGALWVADLESGRRQRLVSDFLMQSYNVTADGDSVVFVASDDSTRSPLWVAALDGSSTPRRIMRNDALRAFFTSGGEVIYTASEREGIFIYSMRTDGSGVRKIFQASTLDAVSPDGKWIAVQAATSAGSNAMIYPRDGRIADSCLRKLRSPAELRARSVAEPGELVAGWEVHLSRSSWNSLRGAASERRGISTDTAWRVALECGCRVAARRDSSAAGQSVRRARSGGLCLHAGDGSAEHLSRSGSVTILRGAAMRKFEAMGETR